MTILITQIIIVILHCKTKILMLFFFLNILFYSEKTWGSLLFLSTYFYLFLPVFAE